MLIFNVGDLFDEKAKPVILNDLDYCSISFAELSRKTGVELTNKKIVVLKPNGKVDVEIEIEKCLKDKVLGTAMCAVYRFIIIDDDKHLTEGDLQKFEQAQMLPPLEKLTL